MAKFKYLPHTEMQHKAIVLYMCSLTHPSHIENNPPVYNIKHVRCDFMFDMKLKSKPNHKSLKQSYDFNIRSHN